MFDILKISEELEFSVEDTIDLVKANKGVQVEFDNDMNDPKVYKLWQDGNSV